MYIFLEYFQRRELYYESDMKKCVFVTKGISCDHTLKISKYISARRERNDKFVKHFQKLFIVLKERHQIIIWWLTRTTLFDEIRTFLVGLKKNLSNKLNNIVVDDYCKVRAVHQFVFLGVEVKLHLFHAVQRVSKNSSWSGWTWLWIGLLLLTVTDVSRTCAVVIFRVKVSCITSVDGIKLLYLILLDFISKSFIRCW